MKSKSVIFLVELVTVASCVERGEIQEIRSTLASANKPSDATGYRHDLAHSGFRLGAGASSRLDEQEQAEYHIGSEGGVSINLRNGAFLAVPSAGAPCFASDWKGSAEEHSARVLDYFLKAGVPAEQIAGTHVLTEMGVDEGPGQLTSPKPRLIAYSTHIDRQVAGVPVPNSRMWASFSADGLIRSEGAFWPTVPGAVVAAATALKAAVDREGLDAFHRRLRSARSDIRETTGRVAILHSDAQSDGPVEFIAAYEVLSDGPKPHSVFFDANQLEVRLKVPVAAPVESTKK
jgi:hypothetical protein